MKKFLLGVLGTVIAGIFVALFTLYINKEKIDVKYNLSAPISIPSEKYYVQQLKIQNVRNATAENLVITLNGNIQKYEIKKYSEQDNIQEFELTDSNGKQICYSKLPKDGSIIITMNINGSDSLKIDIKHDIGLLLFYNITERKYFLVTNHFYCQNRDGKKYEEWQLRMK